MPPRISRQAAPSANPQQNRKKSSKSQKRALNAFATAGRTTSDVSKIRSHRLGQTEDSGRPQKRRRVENEDDDDGGGDEDEDESRGLKRQRAGDQDGDKGSDYGSDSSGNEWRMGGEIGEDSDSSLDSDEAFGESDEERFEDFTFRGSSSKNDKSKKAKKQLAKKKIADGTMDLDENDQGGSEDEDDFGDEGVDLATMLDRTPSDSESSGEEGDTESDGEESASSQSEAESDDADAGKISRLQDLVASLEGQKASKSFGTDTHETQQPTDFGVTASQKLKISDLLPTVTDPALRKSLKVLASDKPAKRGGVPGKLFAPLPKRAQNRLDRTAATQTAKKELEKWQDTVIRNRRAEHLKFPLADPEKSAPQGETQMVGIGQDKPANELESAIQNIMEESGLGSGTKGKEEDTLRAAEELQMKEVPVEEVLARRAALRQARELLFREEIKAKRIKKIKSRSYRKVHRKERERQIERERALYGVDEEEEREREDRRRAEERMGLKHKESKWSKGLKKAGRTVWDEDAREGVVEMARRREELKRRIDGREIRQDEGSGDSELSGEEDDDESDFDEGTDAEKRRTGAQLDRLGQEGTAANKGIAGMAFMQRAEAARKKANDETVEEMRRELAGGDVGSEEDFDEDATIGRQVFGPKAKTAVQPKPAPRTGRNTLEERADSADDVSEEDDVNVIVDNDVEQRPKNSTRPVRTAKTQRDNHHKSQVKAQDEAADDLDEWLTAKVSSKASKSQPLRDYVPTPIKSQNDIAEAMEAQPSKTKQQSKVVNSAAPDTHGWTTMDVVKPNGLADEKDGSSESEAEDPVLTKAQQQELYHARAFAGDDVELAFEEEKAGQVDDEDEKEESNYLPGWGSWAGEGLTKAARRQNAKQKHNPLFKTKVDGVRAADRRDANLKNVIVSEAQQRRGKKYLASQLPHQYEKKDQYERALRIPIGPEWTTKETFQRNTKPRVIVKQGIIAPMEKPLY